MTPEPFLSSSLIVQTHVVLAATALCVGPFAIWRKRRDRLHKILGYLWVVAFGGAALVSFGIPTVTWDFWFGPIHLLPVYGLYGIFVAMKAIFERDIKLHKEVMENVYIRGVCLAGAFNLLPGRMTARSLIPEMPWVGYVVIACVLVWAFVPLLRASRQNRRASARA